MDSNDNSGKNLPQSEDTTEEHEVMKEYVKRDFLDSAKNINDFIKIMIPLNSGLTTAYLAFFRFIITSSGNHVNFEVILPAVFWIVSLVVFVVTIFPKTRKAYFGDYSSMEKYRKSSISWKYNGAIIGAILFIVGLVLMALTTMTFVS